MKKSFMFLLLSLWLALASGCGSDGDVTSHAGKPEFTLVSVYIEPDGASVEPNATLKLRASGQNTGIKWPDHKTIAGTYELTGEDTVIWTLPSKPDTYHFTVSAEANPDKTATATVFVTNAHVDPFDIAMVRVKGGDFTMGCTAEQAEDCLDREKPEHEVTLKSFEIGKYELTQKQWQAVMNSNPSFYRYGPDYPVENVSREDIDKFIQELNRLNKLIDPTRKDYRLPTEAEWEYAARGGSLTHGYKYSGSNNIDDVSWYTSTVPYEPRPVGGEIANELGIYDMSGNVDEWVSDWYGDYSAAPLVDPAGPASGSYRVIRGGSWDLPAGGARVSYRSNNSPDFKGRILGFRLARDAN